MQWLFITRTPSCNCVRSSTYGNKFIVYHISRYRSRGLVKISGGNVKLMFVYALPVLHVCVMTLTVTLSVFSCHVAVVMTSSIVVMSSR